MTKQIIKNCPAYEYVENFSCRAEFEYSLRCECNDDCLLKRIVKKCQDTIINRELYNVEKVYFAGEILREIDNEQVEE